MQFSFVKRYVPDRYKTKEICNKAILENDGTLKFVSDLRIKRSVIKLLIIILMN